MASDRGQGRCKLACRRAVDQRGFAHPRAVLDTAAMQISYLDGPRLRRTLVAACDYAQSQRAELNRINVFPVPDGDTGTNLALTVRAIADHLRRNDHEGVARVAREAAQAAALGCR